MSITELQSQLLQLSTSMRLQLVQILLKSLGLEEFWLEVRKQSPQFMACDDIGKNAVASDITLQDFWAWAYADILSNRNRAIFAEFLVASALDLTQQPRIEWDEVDLRYRSQKIEVKSSAYIQSWPQSRMSTVRFDIDKKRGWNSKTDQMSKQPCRAADCYVFCVFTAQDRQQANVLDLSQWQFIVVATEQINQAFNHQKTIALGLIEKIGRTARYEQLQQTVDQVLATAADMGQD